MSNQEVEVESPAKELEKDFAVQDLIKKVDEIYDKLKELEQNK